MRPGQVAPLWQRIAAIVLVLFAVLFFAIAFTASGGWVLWVLSGVLLFVAYKLLTRHMSMSASRPTNRTARRRYRIRPFIFFRL